MPTTENRTTEKKYGTTNRGTLKAKIDTGVKFHLWNVLNKDYYKKDKNIPGSKWLPESELTEKIAAQNADKNDEIVVYCGSPQCPSSKRAAEKLTSWGYKNVSAYEGGVADWEEGGLPFVSL